MAFLGYSDEFDLDDDGILRDSSESSKPGDWMDYVMDKDTGGILIDDDGIVRDDFDLLSKHGSSTHWTDSGLGGDKPTSTPSTLRQLDLQSYPSFEDVSRNFDESNVNISDFEASKDDLSFDAEFETDVDKSKDFYGDQDRSRNANLGNRSGLSSRSSFDNSLNYDDAFTEKADQTDQKPDLFDEEYYKQLQELGVLVDGDDFADPKHSLPDFEQTEDRYTTNDEHVGEAIEEFLHDTQTPIRDSLDIEMPEHGTDYKQNYFDDSHGFDDYDHRDFRTGEGGKRTRPNTASSTRTISSRSFPEISPEEALELYGEHIHAIDSEHDNLSIQFDQSTSQRTDAGSDNEADDDEIYFVPSQENGNNYGDSPKPAKMPAYDNENVPSVTPKSKSKSRLDRSSDGSRSLTPQDQSHAYSDGSRSVTPQEDDSYHSNGERGDSLTQVTRLDSRNKLHSEGDVFRPDSALSDYSSAASESRSVRPKTKKSSGRKNHSDQQKSNLAHARSQESFFDMNQELTPKKGEKGPKRLLPKPSSGEVNQSFKVKSKSTTNIAALGPVKPTHMSLSEIRNINIDDPDLEFLEPSEPKSGASDVPKGELTKKLKHESSKRQHATQLVQQLQSDYDKLLSKYALAELTIDQMRLGAKISLHANSPTPSQATSGSITSAQHLQMLQLTGPQRGLAAASPQQGSAGVFFPPESMGGDGGNGSQQQQRGTSPALHPPQVLPRSESINSMDSTSTPRGDVEEPGGMANDAEKVKLGLMFQSRNLEDRMQSFQALLGDNQLTLDDQEGVFDKIRGDHEKLRRDYLQSKEDYNVLRRSTPSGADFNFDQEKELEGELFKLGMKFDEIHEKVDENMKEKSVKRQPFQKNRQESEDSADGSVEPDPQTENMKKKLHGVTAGDDMLQPKVDSEMDKKLAKLHEDYNALMDRYRRLKQMGKSPERDKEIDNLVRKLRRICNEEPDIFKLPPDLEDRTSRMNAKEETRMEIQATHDRMRDRSPDKRRLPAEPRSDKFSTNKSPAKSYEILTASETWSLAESMDRWEKSKQTDTELQERSRSRENLDVSRGSSRSFRGDGRRSSASPHGHNRDEPDTGLRHQDRTGSYSSLPSHGRDRDQDSRLRHKDRTGSYSSLSSRGRYSPDLSYNDRDSPVPSLPRPRRHDFPDRERRERRELKKSVVDPLRESTSSFTTDSGIASLHSTTPRVASTPTTPRDPSPRTTPRDPSPGSLTPRKKKPEGGSTTSLQDSGISEHDDGGATGTSGQSSPLSKLPGPGKFKQMTGRREHDTDSGFIGSMVGSEVSAGNLSSRRQPAQSPVRIRHPGDMPARPSSRQSQRSEDSARATTPRSARSVASSKSSRRTPTKAFPLPETKQTETDAARSRTPTRPDSRTKTPTRTGNKSRSRDQAMQHSREYTDDSYTTVTESEMSFDTEPRHGRRGSHNTSHNTSQRHIDRIIEDSEEDQFSVDPTLNETTDLNLSWITSESEQPSIKQNKRVDNSQPATKRSKETANSGVKVTKQPGQGQKQQGSRNKGRSSRTEEDSSMSTLSPTRDSTRDFTHDTTEDTYTTDESTPRSVIERERRAAPAKQKTPSTSKGEKAERQVDPPRPVTPLRAARSEIHPKTLYQQQQPRGPELRGPGLREPDLRALEAQRTSQAVYVDQGIGSGENESILASDADTAATRGSVNSQRLKLLSDEIGKLREEFQRANHEKQQVAPPPPPPAAPPHDPYYDQYFDPTEDPLAFMRGPRRRANSFSGHGGRDWDYDWTLPNVNRDGDIPLGYAAADSYGTPRARQQTQEEVDGPSGTKGRRRLRKRISQRNSGTQHMPEQNGYDSDQSPARVPAEEVQPASARLQGHYGMYSQTPGSHAQQATPHAGLPPPHQPGRRVFGSQPNLAYSGYQPPPKSQGSGSTQSSSSPTRPLRQTLYSYAANPSQNRPQGYAPDYNQRHYASDDIYINDGQTRFVPHGATDVHSAPHGEGRVYTSTCPLCGSSSQHSHGEYVYPPPDNQTPVGYIIQNGRGVLESPQVSVFAMPLSMNLPPRPPPNPFRSHTLPFRIYRAPPNLKQPLFPLGKHSSKFIQTPPKAPPPTPFPRTRPMTATPDATTQPINIGVDPPTVQGGPRTRARSKSAGRMGHIRHYSPDSRVRSRYFVREFGADESDSAESDVEELPRRRSRSVERGRQKMRHGRKYRRVRTDYDDDDRGGLRMPNATSSPNQQKTEKGDNADTKPSMAAEDDLNRSLRLVDEIDELTHKMMDTVGSELKKTKRMKEYGSSFW